MGEIAPDDAGIAPLPSSDVPTLAPSPENRRTVYVVQERIGPGDDGTRFVAVHATRDGAVNKAISLAGEAGVADVDFYNGGFSASGANGLYIGHACEIEG